MEFYSTISFIIAAHYKLKFKWYIWFKSQIEFVNLYNVPFHPIYILTYGLDSVKLLENNYLQICTYEPLVI